MRPMTTEELKAFVGTLAADKDEAFQLGVLALLDRIAVAMENTSMGAWPPARDEYTATK